MYHLCQGKKFFPAANWQPLCSGSSRPESPLCSAWQTWNHHSCSTALLLTRYRKQPETGQETVCRVYSKLPKALSYPNFSQQLITLTKIPCVLKSQRCTWLRANWQQVSKWITLLGIWKTWINLWSLQKPLDSIFSRWMERNGNTPRPSCMAALHLSLRIAFCAIQWF